MLNIYSGHNSEGSRTRGSFSSESQVFEIIHLDENNEEVSNRDKIITGENKIFQRRGE